MSIDTVKSWIEQRRNVLSHAAKGPWRTGGWGALLSANNEQLLAGTATSEGYVQDEADESAIIDAHNMLPRALNALEAVLEDHSRQGLYEPCDSTACALDGEHDHIEVDYGEWVHADERVGWACFTCRGEDGEPSDWPCATVQAIEGAISE